MISQDTAPIPAFTPRAGFLFLALYFIAIALCLAVPRALTFLPSSVSLCGLVYLYIVNRRVPLPDLKFVLFFAGFLALAAASSLWAPDPSFTLEKASKVGGIFLAGLITLTFARAFDRVSHQEKLIVALVVVCAVAAGFIAYEYATLFQITRHVLGIESELRYEWPQPIKSAFIFNRSSVFLVLLCFPVLLMLWTGNHSKRTKTLLSALLGAALFALLATSNSQTAFIAAVLALPMLFYPAHRKKARYLILWLSLTAMLCAPLFAPFMKSILPPEMENAEEGFLAEASIPHRIEVWTFMSEQIMQSPFYGHGMESTRELRAGYIMPRMRTDQVLHPHNAALQIWVEFGIIGMALVMAYVSYVFRKLEAMPPLMQKYNIAFYVVLLGVLSIAYGLWQTWLIGMIFTLYGLGIIASRLAGFHSPENKNGDQ